MIKQVLFITAILMTSTASATTDTSKFIKDEDIYNNTVCRAKFLLPFYESKDVHERVILRDALKDCMYFNNKNRRKKRRNK